VGRVISEKPEVIANEVMQAVVEHTGRETPQDDQTVAVLRVN
jgi:serine phosphatase RsbU (regulator of sigma subunit)